MGDPAEGGNCRRETTQERRHLERERLERLEKARVGRLLSQAKALRKAQEIRASVSAVRDRQATLNDPLSEADFKNWADWAQPGRSNRPGRWCAADFDYHCEANHLSGIAPPPSITVNRSKNRAIDRVTSRLPHSPRDAGPALEWMRSFTPPLGVR